MARKGRGRRTKEMVEIARERIGLLIEQADRVALAGRMDLADRYVDMARKVGMRYNVRFPVMYRRRFCKGCYRYMLPGSTSRIRMSRSRVVTTCLRCGHVMRRPLGEKGGTEGPPGGG